MIPVTTLARKNVAVFGLGGSGIATAQALVAGGAKVHAWDDNAAACSAASDAGVPIVDLTKADWRSFKTLVLAPGVPLTHPEPHWTVAKAKAAKVPIVGDIDLFCRERAMRAPRCPFVAITGTNGKSTTTALIAHLLKEDGRDVQLGGNIGTPVLALDPPHPASFYVIEVSSFQIDLAPLLRPTVGVLTNITPDHLDRHGTMENYAAIKERLVAKAEQSCVGVDDELSLAIAKRIERRRYCYMFSTDEDYRQGYHLDGTRIRFDMGEMHEDLLDLAGIRSLRGRHNGQNALAAAAAIGALGGMLWPASFNPFLKRDPTLQRRLFEDVNDFRKRMALPKGRVLLDPAVTQRRRDALQAAFASFPGLPHRLEEIGRMGRVLFINDSKATNADSTEKALATWPRDVFWIAGGRQKEGGIASLEPWFSCVAKAYLIGESADDFAATLKGKVEVVRAGTLDAAIEAAARDASACGGEEPVVLLSPACASYDQFKNFEVRGEAFRKLVLALPGIEAAGGSAPSEASQLQAGA
jgi:UDP-N-acetylmuramoylalanine--D-glutamate ligase